MNGDKVSSAHVRFLDRFSEVRARAERVVPGRRADFKGERGRLALRVSPEILEDLELLKLAGGGDKNTFCEGALQGALARRLAELKATMDESAWRELALTARATVSGETS